MFAQRASVLIFVLCPLFPASANNTGSDLQNFNPLSRNGDFISIESSRPLTPKKWFWSVYFDQAHNALPVYQLRSADQGVGTEPKTEFQFLRLTTATGLSSFADIGASVGSLLSKKVAPHFFLDSEQPLGLVDIQLFFKTRFLKTNSFGTALSLGFDYLQNRDTPYTGTGAGHNWHWQLISDWKISPRWMIAGNFGVRYRAPGEINTLSVVSPLQNQLFFAAGAHFQALHHTKVVLETFGNASTQEQFLPVTRDTSNMDFLAGFKTRLQRSVVLNYGLTSQLLRGLATAQQRYFIGVSFDQQAIRNSQLADLWTKEPTITSRKWPIIRFNHGRLQMPGNSLDEIHREFSFARENRRWIQKILIVGHTDETGPADFNYQLGLKRATKVADILVRELQIPRTLMEVKSAGETQPIGDSTTVWGRAKNRRVEVTLVLDYSM